MLKALAVVCLAAGLQAATAQTAVPPTYFGLHVQYATNTPSVRFGVQRLWDSEVSWSRIERSRGVYDWAEFDRRMTVAQNNGSQLIYTFGRTPTWASSNPIDSSCAYASSGYGQCHPPANLADWDEFVRRVVTRSAGRVRYWELWNEPNLLKYYKGDISTLVEMARRAHGIIKSIDPNAVVLTPSPTWSTDYKVPAGRTGSDPHVWMNDYLAAGGGGYADVVAYHGYPSRATTESSTVTKIRSLKTVMNNHGAGTLPIFDTEASWGMVTDYPDEDLQAGFVARMYLLHWSEGVSHFSWYGWEYSPWGTLWRSTGIKKSGTAYGEVYSWMVGAEMTRPCAADPTGTWTCVFTRSNYEAMAVWSPNQAVDFVVPTRYTVVRDLTGGRNAVPSNGVVRIDSRPVLLEMAAETAPRKTKRTSSVIRKSSQTSSFSPRLR